MIASSELHEPYKLVGRGVCAVAVPQLTQYYKPLTHVTEIGQEALVAWKCQWLPAAPRNLPWGDWDWEKEVRAYKNSIKRFDVALWSEKILCGLAIGKPSERKNFMNIHLIQGSYDNSHPLKGSIAPIVADLFELYARSLECNNLRFCNPLEGVKPLYENLGFTLEKGGVPWPYCWKRL